MSNAVFIEVNKLIDKIKTNITRMDIDISELCKRLYLSDEEFMDIMHNPRMNVSLYLEILDEVNSMKEV